MQLRDYQRRLDRDIHAAWAEGARVVMATAPTGAGKTALFAHILAEHSEVASAAIAHRRELVSQMSLTLAKYGVYHRVIGAKSLIREIVSLHMGMLGRSYYDAQASCGVVSVDSLPKVPDDDPWLARVGLWIGDEGHHFLADNKWGHAVARFHDRALGLLVTATAFRADGKGLGRSSAGIADALVQGPPMRALIDRGFLTDYRIVAPPSDVDYSAVPVTASGELSPKKLRAAVHSSSRIVGDVVMHYLRFARGKLGVTFAVDVTAAEDLCRAYQAAGVPSAVVSAKTPAVVRASLLKRFRNRDLLQLVNVDLFGEGFDLPAIEVVSMVRRTESRALFDQQFGRVLRPMLSSAGWDGWSDISDAERRARIAASDKPYGLIIDHVGNVLRHLPPDSFREQTLEGRSKRKGKRMAPQLQTCSNDACLAVFPRSERVCPHCGTPVQPASREAPEFVDGDLEWLTPEAMAKLRGDVARVDGAPRIPQGLSGPAGQAIKNRHVERQHAQTELRAVMALWCGWRHAEGDEDWKIQRNFYHTFGCDVLSAQALGRPDAEALRARVQSALDSHMIVPTTDGAVTND